MKRLRITDICPESDSSQVFSALLNGERIYNGGLSFHRPGLVTHDDHRPHVHGDAELFCLLQGEGWIEIDGRREAVRAGDVILIEPGEDHHLISSVTNPLINLWLHADEVGNPAQS